MNERLPKPNKLKSKKLIGSLFESGSSVKAYPLLLVYKKEAAIDVDFKVGFSVSKRNFKHAVDRNRIKRLLREYFRKNKYIIAQESSPFLFMFIFTGKNLPNYDDVSKAMEKIARKFEQQIQQNQKS
ncbi:ribonuclease P protein component [Aquimarina agarivorans]|uniref:ribonuclease P protein component n=1 Tax=Aquimarina agarivorans TaxID=980584 RepID=UPI000248FDA6|nr:ribonuclease P protein component [Aquimarina agarivorans]